MWGGCALWLDFSLSTPQIYRNLFRKYSINILLTFPIFIVEFNVFRYLKGLLCCVCQYQSKAFWINIIFIGLHAVSSIIYFCQMRKAFGFRFLGLDKLFTYFSLFILFTPMKISISAHLISNSLKYIFN